MFRSRFPARAGALASVSLLVACSGNVDFSITKPFDADATGTPPTYSKAQAVDLSADAPDAWKHRDKVKSIDLVGLDGTLDSVVSGTVALACTVATPCTGSLRLRADGAPADGSRDVPVGSFSLTSFPATPHTITWQLSQAGLDIIDNALQGNGKFSVVAAGGTAAPIHFLGTATLHLKLKYKVL